MTSRISILHEEILNQIDIGYSLIQWHIINNFINGMTINFWNIIKCKTHDSWKSTLTFHIIFNILYIKLIFGKNLNLAFPLS